MLAAVVFMVLDARRLRIRYVWLYVVGAALIAISVTFPLYLIARERRLAAAGDDLPPLPAADKVALALVTAGIAAFTVWVDVA